MRVASGACRRDDRHRALTQISGHANASWVSFPNDSPPSPQSSVPSTVYLQAVAKMLHDVFQIPRFSNEKFLSWLYRQNPQGDEVAVDVFHGDVCKAHYCVIPCALASKEARLVGALSLNTAVSSDIRLKGTFSRIAEECYTKAKAQGVTAVIGVANNNSTPGIVKHLGFRLVKPLPVLIGARMSLRHNSVMSHRVSAMSAADLERLLSSVDFDATLRPGRWSVVWNAKLFAWRLRSPASNYILHVSDNALAVSTLEVQHGVRFAVLLKVCRRGPGAIHSRHLASAACNAHGAAFFVYSGQNDDVQFHGVPVPMRFRPRPLNMIYRQLTTDAPGQNEFELGNFEFLDFDAY